MSLADYQRELDSIRSDTKFLAQMHQASRDLERDGYAVIEDVVEPELLIWAHQRFRETVELASGGKFKMPNGPEDLKGFKFGTDWLLNTHGILQDGELAHMDFVHAVRVHPKVFIPYG